MTIDGNLIDNANITDFINAAMRKRKGDDSIAGLEVFSKFLKDIKTPSGLVKNTSLLGFTEKSKRKAAAERFFSDDDDEYKSFAQTLTPTRASTGVKNKTEQSISDSMDPAARRTLYQSGNGGWLPFDF